MGYDTHDDHDSYREYGNQDPRAIQKVDDTQ
jgi:hypothetical protein